MEGRQWFCAGGCTSLAAPVTRPHTIPPPREFSDALAGGGDEQPPRRWFQKDPKSTIAVRHFAGPMVFREQLQHLRVAHLTDLHVGRVTPMAVQEAAVDLTNALAPDLVVITGDFVCHSQMYLDALEALMKRFTVPVLGVLGNHDYWSGADEVRRALRRGGVEVLDNESTILTLRGQKLQVVGLDDAYTGHADREKALKGMRHDVATLGLTHIGEEADRLWPRGVPLVFAGHTHAGQITLARLHELAIGRLAGHKYVHGLYGSRKAPHAEGGALYVGAGIGAAVMPLRMGERGRREVAVFELGAEPGSLDEHHAEQSPLPGRAPSESLMAKRREAVAKKREKRERAKG
jgi:predicted MPP superfamily phosphohydrolase